MSTFLEEVIVHLKTQKGADFRKTCVIFPTRRACMIFRKKLAASLNKPVWSPGILSIGDFMVRHARGFEHPGEEIPLLMALYEVYRKHWPDQDFMHFYPWGKMLINDFDEADKQLSDPTRLFLTLGELKKIEASFLPEPESLHFINEFLDSFNPEKLTQLQNDFARTWDRLRTIYSEYGTLLNQRHLGYEGSYYRNVTGQLKSGDFASQWNHFVFAGFYGFSRVEEELITLLKSKHQTDLLWDYDRFYIDHPLHEAGNYFRKSKLFEPDQSKEGSHFSQNNIHIEITGVPLVAGQAKYIGQLLSAMIKSGTCDLNRTAIILPDEQMLFPVLYSIPHEAGMINVTMGFPLEKSLFGEFFRLLHQLHRHTDKDQEGQTLYHRIIAERLLHHPMTRLAFNWSPDKDTGLRRHKVTAFEIEAVHRFPGTSLIFGNHNTGEEIFGLIKQLLEILNRTFTEKESGQGRMEPAITGFISEELLILEEQLAPHLSTIGNESAWQMIIESINGLKVPFSGEPVSGLQIMGFLESRALDFDTVIIPNINEGILPRTGSASSFIPYSLRKAFGLSTVEEQDASQSYHFYRLLHRAKQVHLLYNTEVGKTGGGEPGRYLLQIKHELKKFMGDQLQLTEQILTTPIHPEPTRTISVEKDQRIMELLHRYREGQPEADQKSFSSSALTTYIHCPMQFYLKYVAKIREREEISQKIEADDFGNILHTAMEKIYRNAGATITPEVIDLLTPSIDESVKQAVLEKYKLELHQLQGNDIILAEVLHHLAVRILENDRIETPFEIISLENKYCGSVKTIQNGSVKLEGIIDRVDKREGVVRIIDYKTGSVSFKKKLDISELFNEPKYKALFQLYFYTLLYRTVHPGVESKAGFYLAKNLSEGIQWPSNEEAFSTDTMESFTERLSSLIDEILDSKTPFSLTDDTERCKHCPYKMICSR